METTTWQYQLVTGDDLSTVVGEGTIETAKDEQLIDAAEWRDVLADLSKQSGQGIQWGERWWHHADSIFDPLDDDGVRTKGQIRYGMKPFTGRWVNVDLIAL